MRALVVLSLWVVVAGCGDVKEAADAASDPVDGAASTIDAPAPIDARVGFDVDNPLPPDAARGPDAALTCGTIGKACGVGGADCDPGQRCQFSVGGSFCTKERPGCGGFAGDTCDSEDAPICAFTEGADSGPCVSAFERDCICESSPTSIEGC